MLTMSQVNHIKDLSNCGYRICEISKKTGADPKTIRKYLTVYNGHIRPTARSNWTTLPEPLTAGCTIRQTADFPPI